MSDTTLRPRNQLSDTSVLWLMGLAFTLLHIVAGARYGAMAASVVGL